MAVRTLLIWLLALALPAQGVSAATMAFCGQTPHRAAAAVHTPHHATARHAHEHPADRAMAAAGADATAVSAGSGVSGAAAPADSHGCSACASCCSAGALLNTLPAVPDPEVAPTVFATVVSTVDAPVADGLERPPRLAVA